MDDRVKEMAEFFEAELKQLDRDFEKYKKEHPLKLDGPDNKAFQTPMIHLVFIPEEEKILKEGFQQGNDNQS